MFAFSAIVTQISFFSTFFHIAKAITQLINLQLTMSIVRDIRNLYTIYERGYNIEHDAGLYMNA